LEFKLLEFLKRSSSDNSADERDRQLMQHERPADLFDEDCGFNTRLRSRRAVTRIGTCSTFVLV
jgi:hypothetical protein